MSISKIQKERKTKELIEQLLKKGIEPNNFELNKLLTEYFDNHIAGMPFYSPIKQKPYEQSDKNAYNHNFSSLKEDLITLYQSNIETNNKAVAMQEYYDTEHIKLFQSLNKLHLRIQNMKESLKAGTCMKQYVQSFDDYYEVEFYGNTKRNIPYTTSFIDLLRKSVHTDKRNTKTNKLSLQNAKIELSGLVSYDSVQTQGELEKVLTDTIQDIYIITAKTIQLRKRILILTIDIGTITEINTVVFKFLSTKSILCHLSLSEDGENYISVYDISNIEHAEWNFGTKAVRYIKIECIKEEPDGIEIINEDMSWYYYYYVLKNISIAKEEYESKSIFVSKIIDFNDLTSTIQLDATDRIFNHTRIDYFIGFDNEEDKIGWDAIENHKPYDLFMFVKRHKIINAHLPNFGEPSPIINAYQLFELPTTVNKNSIKVIPGYHMWSIHQYTRKTEEEIDFNLNSCDFTEFTELCNKNKLFMDCENYDGFLVQCNTLYVFTQYISLNEQNILSNVFFKIMDMNCITEIATAQIKIFLNGYEVTPGENNYYSFGLKKGTNKIQIAIYVPSDTMIQRKLYHNLNFTKLTDDVFACVPMRYISNTILDREVQEDSYEFYTIRNNCIYVKCNPKDMIQSDLNDMGYFITYSCLREDMANYFKDNHIKFRIMAILTSTNKDVSPELLNFRLTGR